VHANINHTSQNNKFKVDFTNTYSYTRNQVNPGDLTGALTNAPDFPPLYDSVGNLNWQTGSLQISNPLASLLTEYDIQTNNLLSNLQLGYNILKNLVVKTALGYNYIQQNEVSVSPKAAINPVFFTLVPSGSSFFGNNAFKSWIIEPQMEYNTKISKGKLNVSLGATFQQTLNSGSAISATGFASDALLKSVASAGSVTAIDGANKQYRYDALYGRVNYNWQDKFNVNFTGRRDGSSRFGPDKQFGNFGAVGAAYIFSNENFIQKNLPFISYGKLRSSYGTTGNDQITDYAFMDTWNSTAYLPYQGQAGLFPLRLFNPDLAWEINKKLEGAMELGLFQDRIRFSLSYFRNRSSNQLVSYRLPVQTGFTSITKNFPALIQNAGLEIEAGLLIIQSKQFSWTTKFNFTNSKSKLIQYDSIQTSPYASRYVVGQPLSVIYRYKYLGVDPATGLFQFQDVNGDGKFDSKDYQIGGYTEPKYYGGIDNIFSYRRFEIDIFFEFKKQLGLNYLGNIYSSPPPGSMRNQPVQVMNYWQKPGDIVPLEKPSATASTAAYKAWSTLGASDGIYSDASYIRLKNLSISYNLPDNWLAKLHIQGSRIYLLGQNLLTITNYEGADPETRSLFTLPPLKTVVVGIQLTL
jgi:TonB-linked SusC/RagA family outer membrane protein